MTPPTPSEYVTIEVSQADAGKRLDLFLQERLPEYSRARLQSWIKAGKVTVSGRPCKASMALRGSESIQVEPLSLPPLRAEPEELPLSVLYEDAAVVVVDKPAGMIVHAGAGRHSGTLVNALLHRFGSLSNAGDDMRPGIVHRIDKDTSGVLVVARTDAAHRALAAQFQSRKVKKEYLAVVQGRPKPSGRVTLPIARDPVRRTRMTARLATGRAAITEYRVLEQFDSFSYLQVTIATGRTHQIRVHLSAIGHPIAGDTLYGAARSVPGLPPFERFFLHAHRLGFESPASGTWIDVTSPLPPDFEHLLSLLRHKIKESE